MTLVSYHFVRWAAILAISSKYILALHNKHLFNPAAIAVVITAFALGESASWWVGTASMLPAVLLGGVLLVRKLRQGEMVLLFVMASLITVCIVSLVQGQSPVFYACLITNRGKSPPGSTVLRG